MKMTTKPKGLVKIWREAKRPFYQGRKCLDNFLRSLYQPLLPLVYRKIAKNNKIVLAEPVATESIISIALGSSELHEKLIECFIQTARNNSEPHKKLIESFIQSMFNRTELHEKLIEVFIQTAPNNPEFLEKLLKPKPLHVAAEEYHKSWNEILSKPKELEKLQSRLVANTDELSGEVVARYVARRHFCAEYRGNPVWSVLQKTYLRSIYPLDYAEQERVMSLSGQAREYTYDLPVYWSGHMETGFGLNQFPLEFQKKVTGKDIIDGGGFSGDSAMVFTEYGPRKVYTFEPNPDSIPAMKQVIMKNAAVLGERRDRIEIVPLALGRSKGLLTLYSNGNKLDGGATVLPNNYCIKSHNVEVISIDEFVENHVLDVGLIKLDIEGAEYETILGAKKTILKYKPLLIISIYHSCRDFFEIKPLIESWEVGYKFEIRHHSPPNLDSELALMAY